MGAAPIIDDKNKHHHRQVWMDPEGMLYPKFAIGKMTYSKIEECLLSE